MTTKKRIGATITRRSLFRRAAGAVAAGLTITTIPKTIDPIVAEVREDATIAIVLRDGREVVTTSRVRRMSDVGGVRIECLDDVRIKAQEEMEIVGVTVAFPWLRALGINHLKANTGMTFPLMLFKGDSLTIAGLSWQVSV